MLFVLKASETKGLNQLSETDLEVGLASCLEHMSPSVTLHFIP